MDNKIGAEIAIAITNVMKAVKNIEKNSNVGFGNSSYKGVKDVDVKAALSDNMAENGLSMLPVNIDTEVKVDRFTEKTNYNGKEQVKHKQSVFVEAHTTYMLLHESGQYIYLQGYGQGVDSQDKAAGKATTYALKYALLYAFMIPTGNIDDADNTHSDDIKTPKTQATQKPQRTITEAKELLETATTKAEYEKAWYSLSSEHQKNEVIINTATNVASKLKK